MHDQPASLEDLLTTCQRELAASAAQDLLADALRLGTAAPAETPSGRHDKNWTGGGGSAPDRAHSSSQHAGYQTSKGATLSVDRRPMPWDAIGTGHSGVGLEADINSAVPGGAPLVAHSDVLREAIQQLSARGADSRARCDFSSLSH